MHYKSSTLTAAHSGHLYISKLRLFACFALLPLAACDIPDKEIGDSEGYGESEESGEDGEDGEVTETVGDTNPEICELMCDYYERQCSFDLCCECILAGGEFNDLAGLTPDDESAYNYECAGTDEPFTFESPACEDGSCHDESTLLADLDEVFAPAGVIPREVIDLVTVPTAAPHIWDQLGVETNTDAATTMQFEVVPTGVVYGLESVWFPPTDLPDEPSPCYNSIEVEVVIDMSTADGALAESFEGTLTADLDKTDPATVSLHTELALAGLAGTLELSPEDPDTILDEEMTLEVDFGQVGAATGEASGELQIAIHPSDDPSLTLSHAKVGHWGVGG